MTVLSIRFTSTMLPQTVEHVVQYSVNSDIADTVRVFDDFCDSMPNAEFRFADVAIAGTNEARMYIDWAAAQLKDKSEFLEPSMLLAAILLAAEIEANADVSAVGQLMYVAYYAKEYADADNIPAFIDSCVDAVHSEEYRVVFDNNEDDAYAEFGKEEEGEETPANVYEYVDWTAVGRDTCDGGLRDWDGDFAVWKDWH